MFDGALTRALTDAAHTPEQRREALVRWAQLPEARFAHPREEHLLPLHVVRVQLRADSCLMPLYLSTVYEQKPGNGVGLFAKLPECDSCLLFARVRMVSVAGQRAQSLWSRCGVPRQTTLLPLFSCAV